MTDTNNIVPIGTPLKKVKDLPKSIITHMPFIMFRPFLKAHNGNEYITMDFLYFYKNLRVTSPFVDGQYFDELPEGNVLKFNAETFDKSIKNMVVKNTYYFKKDLKSNTLFFRMLASQETINAYNKANPKNPIGGGDFIDRDTGLPSFFTNDCEIGIPPVPPT
ncbi:hypothetical protein [Roseivirga misakiensis]|uniref:Uncharacterized protein n=1 Tax=Roseivirga misakiensis TaxID=1563681 RepID=A0A1E5T4L5_9BACT|nr:hypothetical protein [Roseivirga misakiensis]OEK06296.1 hypothetical protein BFP71_01060 [Roseivirga misakiensis]